MTTKPTPITSVEVVVADELAEQASAPRADRIAERIVEGVSELLQRLGIPGRADATVRSGSRSRAVLIVVDGLALPFPPSLLKRVWHTVAPYELHAAPLGDGLATAGFADAWLRSVGTDSDADSVLVDFLADLAVTAIRERPGCLLSEERLATIADAVGSSKNEAEGVDLPGLAQFLVSHGVSLSDRARLRDAVEDTLLLDLAPEDRREVVFDELRAPRIAVLIHPKLVTSLGAKPSRGLSVYDDALNESVHEAFRELEKRLFLDRGIKLPNLVLVADAKLDPEAIVVAVNDLPSLPVRIPEPEQLLVESPRVSLPQPMLAQETYLPANGLPATIVSASYQDELERRGVPFRTNVQSIAAAVGDDAVRRRTALLAVGDVSYQLSTLSMAFPNLVSAALAEFSLGNLTRMLRGLLDEGLSIRDLRLILDRLLDFETVDLEDPAEIVLDRRMGVPAGVPVGRDDWMLLLAFVRAGLADDLARDHADGHGRIDALLLESELEQHAVRVALERDGLGLDPETAERFRDAVWARLPNRKSRATPVLLVSTMARRVVRECLAPELPELGVLAHPEVKSGVRVRRIGTIALDGTR